MRTARLDAVGDLGDNGGRIRDGGAVPELWSAALSSLRGEPDEHLHIVPGANPARTPVAVAAGEAGEADDRLPVHLPGVPGGVARDSERALVALDARDHPGVTVTMESVVVATASGRVRALGGPLTEAEMRAVLTLAGWPAELHDPALAVSWCESKWSPYAVGDGGNSLGLFQIGISCPGWQGWFQYFGVDEASVFDPFTNARVALLIYQYSAERNGYGWAPWSCRSALR